MTQDSKPERVTVTLTREEAEVMLDDGHPVPHHELPLYYRAHDKLRAALEGQGGICRRVERLEALLGHTLPFLPPPHPSHPGTALRDKILAALNLDREDGE